MTFYIHQIYAPPRNEVFEAFGRAGVEDHVWHVQDLADYPWHDPRVAHGLPPGGLVVAREFCDPEDHAWEWHERDAVSWGALAEPEEIRLCMDPAKLVTDVPPPPPFLRWLKRLSLEISAPVTYFCSEFWAGIRERGYAWIFGAEERVYARDSDDDDPRLLETVSTGETRRVEGDLARVALAHQGVDLPTDFFALHTRGFFEDHA